MNGASQTGWPTLPGSSARRSKGKITPTIIVHSLDHALAAAAEAAAVDCALTIRSAPGAAGSVGIGWFAAVIDIVRTRCPTARLHFVLDCADEAGTALAAMRCGIDVIRFSGSSDAADRLIGNGLTLDRDPTPGLDLIGVTNPALCCRNFLAEFAAPRYVLDKT
jgi:hypothetical protein